MGVLQLAAAYAQLKGLLILKNKIATYLLSALIIGGAFAWFFGWDNRLDEKILHTGLEGAQQLSYFFLATLAAVVFTLVVSSMVNIRSSPKLKPKERGLDTLRGGSYFKALRNSFGVNKGNARNSGNR